MTDTHKADGVKDSEVRIWNGLLTQKFQLHEIQAALTLISKWLHMGIQQLQFNFP